MAHNLTEITRRDVLDLMAAERVNPYGRLDELEFLGRVWDLDNMPSCDSRFENARGDITQHTLNNEDWEPGWVYDDERFGLLHGEDETFLRFLCESIHPAVRPDVDAAEKVRCLYNNCLVHDGYEIREQSRISGKPVFGPLYVGVGDTPGIEHVREILSGTDAKYVRQQLRRMEAAVDEDPELAIGTAKDLVETCCKTILHERCVPVPAGAKMTQLVKATVRELDLVPGEIPSEAKAAETIKRLLSNFASIAQGVAELRNHYGTGHGRLPRRNGLQARHAKLAVGAASTLVVFLTETHRARDAKLLTD